MRRFTVRCFDDNGVPVNPEGEDEALPTVNAKTNIQAAEAVRAIPLTDTQRTPMFKRAEVWPYGKPDEKLPLYECER